MRTQSALGDRELAHASKRDGCLGLSHRRTPFLGNMPPIRTEAFVKGERAHEPLIHHRGLEHTALLPIDSQRPLRTTNVLSIVPRSHKDSTMTRLANTHSFGSGAALAAMEFPWRKTSVDRYALAARCMR
jgi:hypothetical protein